MCGDGKKGTARAATTVNTKPGDGCSATCHEEPGFKCIVEGAPCVKIVACGDGIIQPPEVCDDGNTKPGDGLRRHLSPRAGFTCTTPGQA